jgi:MFS family permease
MTETEVKIYPYRWVVLIVFMLINVMVQVLWICYAPIATVAASNFGVSRDSVDLLANLFMLIYLPVSFLASWGIDRIGFKKAVGFGASLMAAFAIVRAVFPFSYTAALIGTIGISIGQPFLLNAFTKLAALWFPQKQRATITWVIFLALFVGIGLGETLGPALLASAGFAGIQLIYAIATAVCVLLFLVFARSSPPTPASPPGEETRALVLDGLKQILKKRDVYLLSLALFIGSGIVNGVFTLIDGIGKEKSFDVSQGVLLTTILLLGGIVGSIVIPAVSDALRRRKTLLLIGLFLAVPATLGLALGRSFPVEIVSFFVMGFCITGLTPLAYQYGAEITHPAPEGTSNGIFALVVQASGFIILLMDAIKDAAGGSYLPSIIGLAVLLALSGFLLLMIRESPEMSRRQKVGGAAEVPVSGFAEDSPLPVQE